MAVDGSLAQKSIREQFPEVKCAEARLLSQGCDFWTFEIDGRWVFRFPRGPQEEESLLKEFSLLDELAEGAPLPVPRYCFRGEPSEMFPHHFGGYEKLPGEPGMCLEPREATLDELAHELGRFLNWLHGHNPEHAVAIGVPRTGPHETLAMSRRWALGDLPAVGKALPSHLREACADFLSDDARLPPEYDGPPRLLHHDYDADHVLIDPAAGRATGIIDWGDACVGDPAWDFARMWAWQGEEFVSAMMREYEHPLDAGAWERIRYPCAWLGLANFSHGQRTGQTQYVEHGMQCLHRVFGEDAHS